jgi:YesN/AraC family two-component response regulator
MPRLLLVEDEPSATRYLRSIIESRCKGFQIVETAENGSEALEKVRLALPDIVITDIKMAVMDGIELAARLGKEFPSIYTVIVSGYQEFEYARGALSSRVVDYLLKPVNARQLKDLLESLGRRVAADYHSRRTELLKGALAGSVVESPQSLKYLPFPHYRMAMIRVGGLPSRYHAHRGERDLARALEPARPMLQGHDIWTIQGRDANEIIFFHTPALTRAEFAQKGIAAIVEKLHGSFHTVFFHPDAVTLDEIAPRVAGLFRAMDSAIVLGRSQVLFGPSESTSVQDPALPEPAEMSRLDFLLSNARYIELEEELRKFFKAWENDRCPQVRIEASLRQIFQLILKKAPRSSVPSGEDFEFLLDEAMHKAADCGELAENTWSLAAKMLQCAPTPQRRMDVPALLDSIQRYLRGNYTDPITLQSVCEAFGISQTYLSRLFRRYENMSFNDFITAIRIEAAKKLILGNQEMPLKDVASFVGYQDQFYFSRVFKAAVGMPPSEYARTRPPAGS